MADSILTVGLNKGLNSVTPPVLAEHGTLMDCLNYEVVPQIGYKKIDGYEQYDGFQSAGIEQIYRVGLTSTASFAVGDLMYANGELIGKVVGKPSATELDFVQLGYTTGPRQFTQVSSGEAGTAITVTVENAPAGTYLTPQEEFALLRTYMSVLRDEVLDLPEEVLGLHWFEDRLYAVAGTGDSARLYYCVDEFISEEEGIARGWHEVPAGIMVEFEKGYSSSDSLTTYSRAFATQEEAPKVSPTPVTGTDGTPVALSQSVNIYGDLSKQAKGWKPSTAPTTYDVAVSNIAADDAEYLYADAMFQWIPSVDVVNIQGGYRSSQLTQNDPAYKLGGLTIGGVAASREFGASNAYTTLVLNGVEELSDNLPQNALIEGIEVEVVYSADVLMYGDNETGATEPVENAAFDIINSMNLRASILKAAAQEYTRLGDGAAAPLVSDKASFTSTESGTKGTTQEWHVYSSGQQTLTIGGPTDLFGNINLTYADMVAAFGLGLTVEPSMNSKPSYANRGAAAYRLKIDQVKIKVYFQNRSSYYYVVGTDGTVIKATLVSAALDYGNYSTGDARGVANLYGLQSEAGTRLTLQAGDKVYARYPVQTGDRPVFEVLSASDAVLPGPTLLDANNSLYQFHSANFYGDAEWDAMYGVSGAGRAFFWDGFVLGSILTQYDPEKDKPRHVAVHHNHLVLGYDSGSVQLSVIGEPSNFSGVDGASEWPMGDNVTGLLSLNGTTLAIFCRKSIHSLAGSSVQNFSQQTISPKQGAIEYSVVDMGQPMFATTNGISTLEQTAAYGDFIGLRASDQVATWLPKRLLGSDKRTTATGVARALPVRAKNQYRLFFKDGLVLTLTMNGEQMNPVMTSRYTYGSADLIPYAASSDIDHAGRERLFISGRYGIALGKVFELDVGWGFNGEWFPHYYEVAPIFPTNGSNSGGVDRVRLHGQTKGLATLNVRIEGVEESYIQSYTLNTQDLSMPINMESYRPEFYPSMSIVDHASRGLGVKILVQGTTPANLNEIEPSHICQVLLLHTITDGARDH